MTELLTAALMRAIEEAAIESGEVTGLELMERAGRGVVEAIFEEWSELGSLDAGGAANNVEAELQRSPRDISSKRKRAVVLCGPGNNGGDGFVVARLLHARGWEVEVFLYGDAEKLPPDAKVNYQRWCELGEVFPLVEGALTAAIERDDVAADWQFDEEIGEINQGQTTTYIDALFGTGLVRKFTDDLFAICGEWTDQCYEHGVAVDIQSGLCSDSGKIVGGNWFFSKVVVTFENPKLGHYLGKLNFDVSRLSQIDLDIWPHEGLENVVKLFRKDMLDLDLKGFFGDGLNKPQQEHKYTHGHALILSGSAGKTGAARLAARGALRIGAGLVTLGVPHEAEAEVAAQITAVMMREVGDAEALRVTLQDPRFNALCLGPGLGLERARNLVPVVLEVGLETHPTRAAVLDADALSAFADAPETLFEMLHENCVLTPHEGEFKRLFPEIHAKLVAPAIKGPAYSKVDATREASKQAGCTVLFKGPDTVIAHPSGRCSINSAQYERAAPWLATAGSGDVLAGFITGLLARGFAPMQAAETAAWLHVQCALKFGPGLIAEDLPEQLPEVFRDLGL